MKALFTTTDGTVLVLPNIGAVSEVSEVPEGMKFIAPKGVRSKRWFYFSVSVSGESVLLVAGNREDLTAERTDLIIKLELWWGNRIS